MHDLNSYWLNAHEYEGITGGPGLFAFGMTDEAWDEFGLGPPPEDDWGNRWVYVGMAPSGLDPRRIRRHLASRSSANSNLRRTLIALLHERHRWQLRPGGLATPGAHNRYALRERDERQLDGWIASKIIVGEWSPAWAKVEQPLGAWHADVLAEVAPPFNFAGCSGPYTDAIKAKRRQAAEIARRYAT